MNEVTLAHAMIAIGSLALGLLLGYFLFPTMRQAKRIREELEQLKAEHEAYKAGVSQHFVKTSELVGEMTRSYAAVYDHLAGGAQRFCGELPETALTFGARPALSDGATFASTAEPIRETPLDEPLSSAEHAGNGEVLSDSVPSESGVATDAHALNGAATPSTSSPLSERGAGA